MIQLDFERKKMMTQAQANQPSQTHLKKMTKKKIEEEKEILRALGVKVWISYSKKKRGRAISETYEI